jgi:hypothetical protein
LEGETTASVAVQDKALPSKRTHPGRVAWLPVFEEKVTEAEAEAEEAKVMEAAAAEATEEAEVVVSPPTPYFRTRAASI